MTGGAAIVLGKKTTGENSRDDTDLTQQLSCDHNDGGWSGSAFVLRPPAVARAALQLLPPPVARAALAAADRSLTPCQLPHVFGENLSLGCHDGEVSLSGSPDQFSCVDRARCPTPAIREPMEPFKPRALTETVVRRFFLKHNKAKLEVPGFIANLMTLPDDEIRSKCQARYHATPEPAHDDFDI